jgi:hypothetical protein
VLCGQDSSVSPGERTRILGSFGFACVVEILALMSSLIRAEMHRGPKNPGAGNRWLERALSLLYVPEQIRDTLLVLRLAAREGTVYRGERWLKAKAAFITATAGESPERIWTDILQAHVAVLGQRYYYRVIHDLLPNYPGNRRAGAVEPLNTYRVLFDPRVFEDKPIIVQGALNTLVIVRRPDGTLAPGPRWQAWIRFLVGALANPPPPPSRRQNRPAGRPNLSVVNGGTASKAGRR